MNSDEIIKEYYSNGQIKIFERWTNRENNLILYESWYENGQLRKRYELKTLDWGVIKYGLQERWYPNGMMMGRKYCYGYNSTHNHGLSEWWYENGQKSVESTFINGKQVGPSTEWYPNGQPEMQCTYKDGKWDGLLERWYENGQLEMRCTYKNGIKINN